MEKILKRHEPRPVTVVNPAAKGDCLILCDHASNRIPEKLGTLGLTPKDLKKHIAWDPGTEGIGRCLSEKLDSTMFATAYSRLVVDVNRGIRSPDCIRTVYDNVRVTGNEGLSRQARQGRIDTFFKPYHKAIHDWISTRRSRGVVPFIISVHSFTPRMDGIDRPWHIGVLWNREADIGRRLVRILREKHRDITVGENEPYSLMAENLTRNTIETHAERRGLPYVLVEIRQDLVTTRAGAKKWGRILYDSLKPLAGDPALRRLYHRRHPAA